MHCIGVGGKDKDKDNEESHRDPVVFGSFVQDIGVGGKGNEESHIDSVVVGGSVAQGIGIGGTGNEESHKDSLAIVEGLAQGIGSCGKVNGESHWDSVVSVGIGGKDKVRDSVVVVGAAQGIGIGGMDKEVAVWGSMQGIGIGGKDCVESASVVIVGGSVQDIGIGGKDNEGSHGDLAAIVGDLAQGINIGGRANQESHWDSVVDVECSAQGIGIGRKGSDESPWPDEISLGRDASLGEDCVESYRDSVVVGMVGGSAQDVGIGRKDHEESPSDSGTCNSVVEQPVQFVEVCGTLTNVTVFLRNRCESYRSYQVDVGACDTEQDTATCKTESPATMAWLRTAQRYIVLEKQEQLRAVPLGAWRAWARQGLAGASGPWQHGMLQAGMQGARGGSAAVWPPLPEPWRTTMASRLQV